MDDLGATATSIFGGKIPNVQMLTSVVKSVQELFTYLVKGVRLNMISAQWQRIASGSCDLHGYRELLFAFPSSRIRV